MRSQPKIIPGLRIKCGREREVREREETRGCEPFALHAPIHTPGYVGGR